MGVDRILSKGLVVAVVLLFLGLAIQPSIATIQPEGVDVDNKPKGNILVDSINEIISVINGKCAVNKMQSQFGIIRNIIFTDAYYWGWLHLRILLSNPFQLKLIFTSFPHKINAPLFIGYAFQTAEPGVFIVWGVALGNIDW